MPGKAQDSRRPADVIEPADNLPLLNVQPFRREDGVALGFSGRADVVQEAAERRVSRRALPTIDQMLRDPRVDRFALSPSDVAVEEAILLEVARAQDHGFPPSNPRSLRAARNKWTRTVDSFSPVITLISRGVQSP